MAKAAELNGYPGPKHVLQLAGQLGLTDTQRRDVQAIFDRMSAAAKSLGGELIAQEQTLDQLFVKGVITPDRLAAATAAIAELQGRLRAVHLSPRLETRALLNADQIARHEQLRAMAILRDRHNITITDRAAAWSRTPTFYSAARHGRTSHAAKLLATLTLVWLGIEGTVGVVAGILAGSIALVAFQQRADHADQPKGQHGAEPDNAHHNPLNPARKTAHGVDRRPRRSSRCAPIPPERVRSWA